MAFLSLEQLMEAVGARVKREMQTYASQATQVDHQQQLPVSLGKLPLHGCHCMLDIHTAAVYWLVPLPACAGSIMYRVQMCHSVVGLCAECRCGWLVPSLASAGSAVY
jgi:hypothetical protein